MTDPVKLGADLKALRQARGLSLRVAAAEIGVTHNYLHRLERGEADLKPLLALEWMGDQDADTNVWRARALTAEWALVAIRRILDGYDDRLVR